jgi:mannose-6-phosphate isomerase-like protein (cupin superfamily)
MDNLLNRLENISFEEVKSLGDEAVIDPSVGVSLSKLPLDPVSVDGLDFYFFAVKVNPGIQLKPHYHSKGVEPYYIPEGASEENVATMYLKGQNDTDFSDNKLKPGQIKVVGEGQVHSIKNTGESPFYFVVSCPKAHLCDAGAKTEDGDDGDRHFE